MGWKPCQCFYQDAPVFFRVQMEASSHTSSAVTAIHAGLISWCHWKSRFSMAGGVVILLSMLCYCWFLHHPLAGISVHQIAHFEGSPLHQIGGGHSGGQGQTTWRTARKPTTSTWTLPRNGSTGTPGLKSQVLDGCLEEAGNQDQLR